MAMEDLVERLKTAETKADVLQAVHDECKKASDEEARCRKAEKGIFEAMMEKIQKPAVENVIEHLEVAYAVKDHDGTVICWCATKDKADLVAACVDMTRRTTVGIMVHKMFS